MVHAPSQTLPTGIRVVVFDVGETLVDESRLWAEQATSVGVTPFTLMSLIGALIERGDPHQKAWEILGIAGNQPAGAVERLRELGFEAAFVASSAEWGVAKPHPEFFTRIIDAVSPAIASHEILYVGDRLDNDIVPAAAVGMRTALLRRGPWGHVHSAWPEAVVADLRLESLDELSSLLPFESAL